MFPPPVSNGQAPLVARPSAPAPTPQLVWSNPNPLRRGRAVVGNPAPRLELVVRMA